MRILLRIFFHLLYHQFAFAYDFVAASVSFGHWKDWVMEVVPFIEGNRILEIGHGPGHLQRVLLDRGLVAVGMDESKQMSRLTKRNTDGSARLTRGLAQHIPFRDKAFDTIIATFPSEYFVDPQTLSEIKRCLLNEGRFIVLPVALPRNRFLSWLYRVTGQAPSETLKTIREKMEAPFIKSGFNVETQVLDVKSGTLVLVVAKRKRK